MPNVKKINETMGMVVTIARTIVTLADIWEQIGPSVKKALLPVLSGCRNIASASNTIEKEPFIIKNGSSLNA